jgi:gamma-glutamyltranspeptidase
MPEKIMEDEPRPNQSQSREVLGQLKPTPVDTDLLELGDRKIYWPQKVAVSRRGMIANRALPTTEAGVEILEAGGNAFDASVAAAFALGICEPAASGLGGQNHANDSPR